MSNPYIGLWAECRDGTIGEIVEMDKAGYCTLKDIHGVIVKKHEPINKLQTEKDDGGIYTAGVAGKRRR